MTDDREYLAAGLAAGGLDPDDQRAAEELERTDPGFRAQADEYREALAGLVASGPPEPIGADLERSILAIPQDHPREKAQGGSPASPPDEPSLVGGEAGDHGARGPRKTGGGAGTQAENEAGAPVADLGERRRAGRGRGARTWAALGAAAAVIAIAALGITTVRAVGEREEAQQQLSATRAQAEQSNRLLTAPDLRSGELKVKGGGTVDVSYSTAERLMMVAPQQLASPGDDRSLQLWIIADGKAASAGLLAQRSAVFEPPEFEKGAVLGLTVEPAGGSPAPTSAPVGSLTL